MANLLHSFIYSADCLRVMDLNPQSEIASMKDSVLFAALTLL